MMSDSRLNPAEEDDPDLEEALRASILTAKEDDTRRREKYGIITHTVVEERPRPASTGPIVGSRVTSSKAFTHNLVGQRKSAPAEDPGPPRRPPPPSSIARPRPGRRNEWQSSAPSSSSPSPIHYRPIPDIITDHHTPPPLPSVGPNATIRSVTPPVSASTSVGSHSPRLTRSQKIPITTSASSKAAALYSDDKPLIALSPPTRSKDPFDFDLSSFDPLGPKSDQSGPASANQSVSILDMPVAKGPAVSAGGSNVSARSKTATDGPMKAITYGGVTGTSSNYALQPASHMYPMLSVQQPNTGQKTGGFLQGSVAAALPSLAAIGMASHTSMLPPASTIPTRATTPVRGASPIFGIPTNPAIMPQIAPSHATSGNPWSSALGSVGSAPTITSMPASGTSNITTPTSPSIGTIPLVPTKPVTLAVASTSVMRSKSPLSFSRTPGTSTPSLCGGDLMEFGFDPAGIDYDFLSLEAFDPLYASEYEKKIEKITKVTEPKEEKDESEAARARAESDVNFEIQDPFCVDKLTRMLEKKRKKHAQERQEREALLRENQAAQTEIPNQNKKALEGKPTENHAGVLMRDKRHAALEQRSRRNSYIARRQESCYESLQEFHETADSEIEAFCGMVIELKERYSSSDPVANRGLVISPQLKHPPFREMSVKLVIHTKLASEAVIFTCDLSASIEQVIAQVLSNVSSDDISTEDFVIKVFGLQEYCLNESILGSYEYVQQCIKLDEDIKLVLVHIQDIRKVLLRTLEDDKQPVFMPKPRDLEDKETKITKDKLNILMETFYKECEKLRDQALQHGCEQVHARSVLQSVKAICAVLCKIETIDIIKAGQKLQMLTVEKTLQPTSPKNPEGFVLVTADGDIVATVTDSDIKRLSEIDDLHIALEEVTQSVKSLIELYCRTFHTDFRFESTTHFIRDKRSLAGVHENFIVHVASLHRIPLKWRNVYEEFKVIVGLYHGGRQLCPDVTTQMRPNPYEGSFQETIIWDEWVLFESVLISDLPRETRMTFSLVGVKTVASETDKKGGSHKVNAPLGWVALQVFDHSFELVQGSQMLGLWVGESANPLGTSQSNTEMLSSVLIQINLPDFDFDVNFPEIEEPGPSLAQEFQELHPCDQAPLKAILEKDTITRLSVDEAEFLWEKRLYLYDIPEALPKVIAASPNWHHRNLPDIYNMLEHWAPPKRPVDALPIMLPEFADTQVRSKSIELLQALTDDELLDYLMELIQALKFESYHTSALARFLLERASMSIRVAHHMYWLLKEAAEDIRYRKRYQLMFGALLSVAGRAMRKEFSKQEDLTKMLAAIAEKVKAAKEKEAVLQRELENMFDFLQHESTQLPLNPSMEIMDVDTKSCSYFTSNTFPLKLVLQNVDAKAEPIYTMFKVGDDLRQDMLTMQLIRVMDKVWLSEGLDLRIITFRCQATGYNKGLIELVTNAETLRKIQVKHGHGVAGSFKDRPIAEWLQVQNPTELEYHKAVDNFIASCAGYCVATYILGICDRHNDNIMIKHSGHMFHIDFGKFLGDAQRFGNIKRDRTAFVLTSDMAYVINGGGQTSHKFQIFVDLCCQAFNILRKHANLFLSLFSMMNYSGVRGVNEHAVKYVQRSLLLELTDTEATAFFTRLIEESLKSVFTQINFFIHNLAQIKWSGHNEGALLSFIPKTYSLQTDGKIGNISVFGYQKRYNPDKYYIYIIKVDREGQRVPSFIFRRYSEFQELHHKLLLMFPLVKLPSLPAKVLIGRTHVKTVAEARKGEVEKFLRQLLTTSTEVAECDLVYTFFHPMLRDEQDIDKTNLQKLKGHPSIKEEEPQLQKNQGRLIQGQVKLSIHYKNDTLTIMIMHVKDLCGEAGEVPDAYVKLYLIPDPMKLTKRKTKVVRATFHPTYNEVLAYQMAYEDMVLRTLQVSVWSYAALEENEFLGATHIPLKDLELGTQTVRWFPLQNLHHVTLMS